MSQDDHVVFERSNPLKALVLGPSTFWRLTPLLVAGVAVALAAHICLVHRFDPRFSALSLVPALPDCVDLCCTVGLKIVTRLCDEIEYRRYNGVNICKLSFPKEPL